MMLFADLKRENDGVEVRGCEAVVCNIYPENSGVAKTGRPWSFVPMMLRDGSGEQMKLTWWNGDAAAVKEGDDLTITKGKVSRRTHNGKEYVELQADSDGVVINSGTSTSAGSSGSGGGALTDIELLERMRIYWNLMEFAGEEQRVKLVVTLAIALADHRITVDDGDEEIPF